jgi:hypothetical protein
VEELAACVRPGHPPADQELVANDPRQSSLLWDTATLLLLLSSTGINRLILTFHESEWNAFLSGTDAGEFDSVDVGLA